MPYKITPENKNSITEIEIWRKGTETFSIIRNWRWGNVTVEENPDLSDYDPENGINVNDECFVIDTELDGAEIDFEFGDDIPEEIRPQLIRVWTDEMDDGLVQLGWEVYETECWFYGELEIKEI